MYNNKLLRQIITTNHKSNTALFATIMLIVADKETQKISKSQSRAKSWPEVWWEGKVLGHGQHFRAPHVARSE